MRPEAATRVLSYDEFRTGLDFGTVAAGLNEEARMVRELEGRRMFITRRTILGRWHQIKRESYKAYRRYAEADHA